MKIVEPKVELWKVENEEDHIAKCARVCYASEPKTTSNKVFCQKLWNSKHWSVYRHAPVYYIIPCEINVPNRAFAYCKKFMFDGKWYLSTNMQCAREYFSNYEQYRISIKEAENNNIFKVNKLLMYTFCIQTGIDITREYNRKSPNNITEQSTRYVDFIKRVGISFKKCHWMYKLNWYKKFIVLLMAKVDEWFYKISRSKYGLNLRPEDARWCLFLDTMSKVCYTYSVADWIDIINMRYYGNTGTPHPDAKIVAAKIKYLLSEEGYYI